jgi:hypothetical protein
MSNASRPNDLSQWFASPPSRGANDLRLTEWRGNYDEARAIARYVERVAEGKGIARRSPGSRTEAR